MHMVKEQKTSPLPGYLTSEEAAHMLGVSKYRLYQYVKEGRIPALTFGNAYMLMAEDVERFRPLPSGRTRIKPPSWHTYRSGGKLLVTQIQVQIRQGQQQRLREKLQAISDADQHAFPGTIARYVAEGDEQLSSLYILLIWKTTEMPVEATRQGYLATFQAELDDVLDWETAHLQTTHALIHT
jgi:excisionase family DNA binding protein